MRALRKYGVRDALPKMCRPLLLAPLAVMSGFLSACDEYSKADLRAFGTTLTIQEPDDEKFSAADEPYRLGVEQFNRGYYGNAVKYFQEAIEKSPKDVPAWISLAACYDHLRAFDLADKSYERAIVLGGKSAHLLNNLGYSYVLRGNFHKAQQKFEEALQLDPGNVFIQNNLRRVESKQAHGWQVRS